MNVSNFHIYIDIYILQVEVETQIFKFNKKFRLNNKKFGLNIKKIIKIYK